MDRQAINVDNVATKLRILKELDEEFTRKWKTLEQ